MRALGGVTVLGFAVALLAGGVARADQASCEVPIIHALPGGSAKAEIDPQIGALRTYLTRPPFTAWHQFKLLDRKTLSIPEGGSQSFMMPNGRQSTLTFVGHTGGPGEHRMRLKLEIEHAEKKHKDLATTFVLDEGGVVLHAGEQHEGGILILGISCKTQH